ncbi:hypothetical protein CYMTET_17841 [Cymbomonas tetramitiformis]|uniref:Uncharacterized protein n=1 Tax=Cymbomonas tetramitiformis TaxID=36881 RepID=A0AAE0L6R2_9CHLO|nr:hypothetical protein CYMTET_17841 [Cymbomonas tetramitiformis]
MGCTEQAEASGHPSSEGQVGNSFESIVAVGGSLFADWEWLSKSILPYPMANRAISASTMRDTYDAMDYQVVNSKPRLVVFNNGGDELLEKVEGEKIAEQFSAYCKRLEKKSPNTHILFVSILNSMRQWEGTWQWRMIYYGELGPRL